LPTGISAVPQNQEIEAVRELASNLCYAASEISGPIIFNEETKSELRRLYKSLFLALDHDLKNTQTNSYQAFFDKVTECTYIPNPITVKELTSFQVQLAAKGLAQITPLIVDALGLFCLRLTTGKVSELSNLINAIFNTINDLIASINRALSAIQRQLQRINESYEDTLEDFEDALEDLQHQLGNTAAMKDAFLADLKRAGLNKIDPSDTAALTLFEVSFTAASVVIGSCFDLIGLSIKLGINEVDKLEDIPQIIQNVIIEFNNGVTDIIANSPIPLPAEITFSDIENACMDLLDNLNDKMADLAAKKEAEIKAHRAKTAKEEQRILHEELLAEIQASNSIPPNVIAKVEFQSPLAFLNPKSGKNLDWVYGKEIPVEVTIKEASTKLLCTEPQGIFLAINGLPFKYELDDWSISRSGKNLRYSTTLRYGAHNLRSGINVIECTIVQNGSTIQKNRVEFMMNPNLASRSTIILDLKNSNINTVGDDHENTASEYICLKNEGNMPAELTNWLVTDGKNHQYVLPKVRFLPKESLRIHTGLGTNTALNLYQNRKRAVWNNTGDLVMVVNEHKVLVIYGKY
jgi:Skp family chaperone for outer membrane proteins